MKTKTLINRVFYPLVFISAVAGLVGTLTGNAFWRELTFWSRTAYIVVAFVLIQRLENLVDQYGPLVDSLRRISAQVSELQEAEGNVQEAEAALQEAEAKRSLVRRFIRRSRGNLR